MNSSPKKNSITSSDDYDRVQSGGTGAGWSGIHWELMNILGQYGIASNSREEAIRTFKNLLDEYESNNFGTNQKQSDEDYLKKFNDID